MNKTQFEEIITTLYLPLMIGHGFTMSDLKISGRLYAAKFSDSRKRIDVCYEPGDEFVSIYFFSKVSDGWSDIDDLNVTPRLNDLAKKFMPMVSADEIEKANQHFGKVKSADDASKKLIRSARDLFLILPLYLADLTALGSAPNH